MKTKIKQPKIAFTINLRGSLDIKCGADQQVYKFVFRDISECVGILHELNQQCNTIRGYRTSYNNGLCWPSQRSTRALPLRSLVVLWGLELQNL